MQYIKLTKNKRAKVCDCHFDLASKNKWHFDGYYAARNQWLKDEKRYQGYRMHAVIMNTPKGMDTDHINGDKLDNRCSNLRVVSRSQNKVNGASMVKSNTSGVKGVHYDKSRKKWMAFLSVGGKFNNLGRFKTKSEAVSARQEAEATYLSKSSELKDKNSDCRVYK